MEISKSPIHCPAWSELPSLAVENIYIFLNRTDQNSLSLVCRNWRKVYSSPSLKRRLKFCFPNVPNTTELCADIIYARRYGAMFHHVEVIFEAPPQPIYSIYSLPIICRQLKLFLEALTRHSQLLSISLKNIPDYLLYFKDENLSDTCQVLLNFFESQNRLQYVEINNCLFRLSEVARMLKVLSRNNHKTLRYLLGSLSTESEESGYLISRMDHHFREEIKFNIVDDDLNFLLLMNLEVLEICFSEMFESMILSFYEYRNRVDMRGRKGCLKEIKLTINGFGKVYGRIKPCTWKYLKNVFPSLRINLKFFPFFSLEHCTALIVPHMPLTTLNFRCINRLLSDTQIDSLLHHITYCEINKCLEVLKISKISRFFKVSTQLIAVTDVCSELKILELEANHPVADLDTIFSSWLENRPMSLRVVKITITGVQTEKEKSIYTHLSNFYTPLLLPLKLTFSLLESAFPLGV